VLIIDQMFDTKDMYHLGWTR